MRRLQPLIKEKGLGERGMYKIVDESGFVYTQYIYLKEADFEKMIVAHAEQIFLSLIHI